MQRLTIESRAAKANEAVSPKVQRWSGKTAEKKSRGSEEDESMDLVVRPSRGAAV
jgi:hypothetical protein